MIRGNFVHGAQVQYVHPIRAFGDRTYCSFSTPFFDPPPSSVRGRSTSPCCIIDHVVFAAQQPAGSGEASPLAPSIPAVARRVSWQPCELVVNLIIGSEEAKLASYQEDQLARSSQFRFNSWLPGVSAAVGDGGKLG